MKRQYFLWDMDPDNPMDVNRTHELIRQFEAAEEAGTVQAWYDSLEEYDRAVFDRFVTQQRMFGLLFPVR